MKVIKTTVPVELTPKELAELFCSMDSGEMADFFNEAAAEVNTWDSPFPFQMQSIVDTKKLNDAAKEMMNIIGEYSFAISSEPRPTITEAHGWTRDMILELIKKINAICGPDEVLSDLSKLPGPITEEDVLHAISRNEPF